MVRKEEKISDETIQLYLMGELAGPLFDRVRSIDEAPDPTALSAADSVIRETITKLRSVDQMLQEAADTSFQMPAELSAKIELALAADNTKNERRSRTGLTAIKGIFSWSNFWSMASGTALASIGFLALIYWQPEAVKPVYHGFSAPEFLASRSGGVYKTDPSLTDFAMAELTPLRNAERDTVEISRSKLVALLEKHSRVVEELREVERSEFTTILDGESELRRYDAAPLSAFRSSLGAEGENFTITASLAFRVVISDQFGAFAVLENKSEVFLDESFHVDLLPLQNIDLSILYRASDGVTTTLVSDEKLTVGKPYSFPADLNGEATWQFAEQEGIDSLVFRTSDGSVHEIHFAVKE